MKRTATGEQMQAFCPWQECHDENSGYPYYWNMTTNEVTWEMPAEYQLALQKWQLLQQQQLAASDKKSADTSSQISSASVCEKLEAGKKKLNNNRKGSPLTKKNYPMDSDSEEDEKIELITSYGSDSSDNSDSDSSSHSKSRSMKLNVDASKNKSSSPRVSKPASKPDARSTNTNVYGPCFPLDRSSNHSVSKTADSLEEKKIKGISLVPYADTSDVMNSDESFTSNSISNRSGSDGRCVESSKTISDDVKIKNGTSTNESKTSDHKTLVSDEEEGDDEEDEADDFDEDESLILSKLRSQAMVLKQLGGEIPDEIKCLIDSENPDIGIDDIIALIENETPPDHSDKSNCDKSLLSKESVKLADKKDAMSLGKADSPKSVSEQSELSSDKELVKANRPSSFALIAGYGDDSDQDEATSPTKSSGAGALKRKALFPIDDKQNKSHVAIKAELSTKPVFKKIKLSARAKALINASIITAKARATPFINNVEERTAEGIPDASICPSKPEEKLVETVPMKDPVISTHKELLDSKKVPIEDIKPLLSEKMELPEKKKTQETQKQESPKQNSLLLNGPTVQQASPKPSTSTSASRLKPFCAGLETSTPQSSSYTTVWDSATTYTTDEKRGFGFSDDVKPSSSSSSFSVYRNKSDKKEAGIQFIKAETINANPPAPVPPVIPSFIEIEKEENVSKSEIESLSELIVEKVKYLSEGKEPVSPVQIMTIQIETLASAWQAGCLSGKYLLDWLNATSKQLSSLEEEAAPPGWKCEWDRSFSRYYYRNKETGNIQWEYPVDKESEEVLEEVEMELCETPPPPSSPVPSPPKTPPPPPEEPPLPKTPPPPVISFSPPPPPIISSSAASSKKSAPPKKKSKIDTLAIELPPLPASPPPLPKNPPPPPPDAPLPPLPPSVPSSSVLRIVSVPLSPSVNTYKRQKTVNEFNMNNAQFYPAQQIPPPPPSIRPPLPPTAPPSRPLFPAASQQPPLPSSHGSAPRSSLSNQVPDKMSHQVIGAPAYTSQPAQPPLPPAETDLNLALDSFYSDIASLEATVPEESSMSEPAPPLPEQAAPGIPSESEHSTVPKKKKKVKLAAGLTLKKKGLDSLVAKWEKVHKSVCD